MWKVLPLLLALAACGRGPDQSAAAENMSAPAALTNYQQAIVDLPEGQRHAVLFRAITDAGQDCQGVEVAQRQGDDAGRPTYAARCTNGTTFLVAIAPNGVAQVTGVQQKK